MSNSRMNIPKNSVDFSKNHQNLQPVSYVVTAYNRKNHQTATFTYLDEKKATESVLELSKLGLVAVQHPDFW